MSGSEAMNTYLFTRLKVCVQPLVSYPPRTGITTARQEDLRTIITDLLQEWQLVDPSVRLAPWSGSDDSNAHLPLKKGGTGSEVLVHQGVAPKYFSQLNWNIKKDQELWFHMRIRHTARMADLFLAKRPDGLILYLDRLQSSETAVPGGFFVYSIKNYVNSEVFHQALRTALIESFGGVCDFALHWSPVKYKPIHLNGPFAMQLEVDEKDYADLRNALAILYNQEKKYPLGIKMVYIPPPGRCVDKRLVFTACDNQHQFGVHVRVHEFRPFRLIYELSKKLPLKLKPPVATGTSTIDGQMSEADDSSPAELLLLLNPTSTAVIQHMTLPELFLTIPLGDKLVFHSVLAESDHRGQVLYLVIPPGDRYDYAQMIIKSPVAFFGQILDDTTLAQVFNAEAIQAGRFEAYDPNTNTVINTFEVDASSAMASMVFDFPPHFNTRPSTYQPHRYNNDNDAASFSFSAGSVQTVSKKKKVSYSDDTQAVTHRFPIAFANLNKVPGPPNQGTGEKK
jgi:hypothetical protein